MGFSCYLCPSFNTLNILTYQRLITMQTITKTLCLFFLMGICCLPSQLLAQKTLRQKLSDEFCKELNKQDISETWDEKSMEKIGLVILPVVSKFKEEIKKEMGLEMTSQEDFQKVGEIIGAEAVINCPKFQKMMRQMSEGKKQEVKMLTTLEGTFLGVATSGNFSYLRIKGSDGRENKVWWFQFFPGSDQVANFKDKAVTLTCIEEEIYEPTLKDYVKIKIAQSIKLK